MTPAVAAASTTPARRFQIPLVNLTSFLRFGKIRPSGWQIDLAISLPPASVRGRSRMDSARAFQGNPFAKDLDRRCGVRVRPTWNGSQASAYGYA
jgi:hypothetical protein